MCIREVCVLERNFSIRERCEYWIEVWVLERGLCIRERRVY